MFVPSERKRLILAALFLVALGVCGLWMLSRETTLIYAANALSQRLDGRLQTVDLRGSLLGTITAGELRYQDRFGKIAIKDARLEWRPMRLLIGQVAVGAMTADNGHARAGETEGRTRKPPESLAAPISFAMTDFRSPRCRSCGPKRHRKSAGCVRRFRAIEGSSQPK